MLIIREKSLSGDFTTYNIGETSQASRACACSKSAPSMGSSHSVDYRMLYAQAVIREIKEAPTRNGAIAESRPNYEGAQSGGNRKLA